MFASKSEKKWEGLCTYDGIFAMITDVLQDTI